MRLILSALVLAGCTEAPTPVDCRVPDPCEPIVTVAYEALQGEVAARVDRAVVRETAYRLCMEGVPAFDVTFIDDASASTLEVTVARTPAGDLAACTY
jgi:hypothetical protein